MAAPAGNADVQQFGFQHAAALGEHIDGRLFSLWPLEGEGPAVAHANVDLDGDQVASLLVDHIAMANFPATAAWGRHVQQP